MVPALPGRLPATWSLVARTDVTDDPPEARSLREVLVEAEREHLKIVLRGVGGHRTKAASVLGISRKVLWEKLKDYGIE